MEDSQYKTIEQQALQIVDVLNKLKDEIETYKDAKIDTQENLNKLNELIDAVTGATKQLKSTAKSIEDSDYVALHEKMTDEVEALASTSGALQQNVEKVPAEVEKLLEQHQEKQLSLQAEQAEKNKEMLERISNLEEVVARIDRNTQKGFGKEKG